MLVAHLKESMSRSTAIGQSEPGTSYKRASSIAFELGGKFSWRRYKAVSTASMTIAKRATSSVFRLPGDAPSSASSMSCVLVSWYICFKRILISCRDARSSVRAVRRGCIALATDTFSLSAHKRSSGLYSPGANVDPTGQTRLSRSRDSHTIAGSSRIRMVVLWHFRAEAAYK